jgi:hypothetical protein
VRWAVQRFGDPGFGILASFFCRCKTFFGTRTLFATCCELLDGKGRRLVEFRLRSLSLSQNIASLFPKGIGPRKLVQQCPAAVLDFVRRFRKCLGLIRRFRTAIIQSSYMSVSIFGAGFPVAALQRNHFQPPFAGIGLAPQPLIGSARFCQSRAVRHDFAAQCGKAFANRIDIRHFAKPLFGFRDTDLRFFEIFFQMRLAVFQTGTACCQLTGCTLRSRESLTRFIKLALVGTPLIARDTFLFDGLADACFGSLHILLSLLGAFARGNRFLF